MPPETRSIDTVNFLLVRLLAVVGIGVSGYLLSLKLLGKIDSLAGCGGDSGCANVLGSRWSQWVFLPVSGLSLIFYLGIIALTIKPSRTLLVTAALTLLAAAFWFLCLQIFLIESFCPWCLATHIIGILTALTIFFSTRSTETVPWASCSILALALTSVLIGGQIYGPRPASHALARSDSAINSPIHLRGKGELLSFGEKKFNISTLPKIGPADAEFVMVKYFDYTCKSCRELEGDLEALLKKHPGKFCVVLLPVPLNRKCNDHLKPESKDQPWSCELAKMGMAAWRARPESFPAVHQLLFSRPFISMEDARQEIYQLIPENLFQIGMTDPWVDELITANTLDYQILSKKSSKLPQLLVIDSEILQGGAASSEEFIEVIENLLGL